MSLSDKRCPSLFCRLLLWIVCLTGVLAADQPLFDFGHTTHSSRFSKSDASVTAVKVPAGMVMRLATGTSQPWPGVTLPAPDGHWDLSPYAQVVVEVKNAGEKRATLSCRVDNPGADGTEHCVNGALTLNARQSGTLRVTLLRIGNDTLGVAFSAPAPSLAGTFSSLTSAGDMPLVIAQGAPLTHVQETDIQLGYVTNFLDGAVALQTNAAYQTNAQGQRGATAVSLLSRAKIKF